MSDLLTIDDHDAITAEILRRGQAAGDKLRERILDKRRAGRPKADPRQIDMFGGAPAQLDLQPKDDDQ